MTELTFLGYPKCSTSRKAQKWLDDHGIAYSWRDIVIDNPTKTEIKKWHALSGLPMRRLFNTSGVLYREHNIKAKLDGGISDDEAYDLLASDGKMVKRPILLGGDFAFFGFKENEWQEKLLG